MTLYAQAVLQAEAERHEHIPAVPLVRLGLDGWRRRLFGSWFARVFIRSFPPAYSSLTGRDGYLEVRR